LYSLARLLGRYDLWRQVECGKAPTLGFPSESQDSLGMVYPRARWYHAAQGRSGVPDPFAEFPEQPYSSHPYP
jgi:hypothetical protein